jgi:hypothetical protein
MKSTEIRERFQKLYNKFMRASEKAPGNYQDAAINDLYEVMADVIGCLERLERKAN